MTGSLLGFAPLGMYFKRDASAVTYFPASIRGLRDVIISAIGYLGPSVFGLWAAKLIETGHFVAVLWIAIVLLVLLLFLIRKSFGLVSVPVAIAVLALVMRNGHSGVEEFTAYAMTWLLLLSGIRVAVAHGARADDARILSDSTRLPRRSGPCCGWRAPSSPSSSAGSGSSCGPDALAVAQRGSAGEPGAEPRTRQFSPASPCSHRGITCGSTSGAAGARPGRAAIEIPI